MCCYIGDPVIAVFDNLLRDNDAVRQSIAAKTGALGHDPCNLLAAIGRDCVGALQFLPQRSSRSGSESDTGIAFSQSSHDWPLAALLASSARFADSGSMHSHASADVEVHRRRVAAI